MNKELTIKEAKIVCRRFSGYPGYENSKRGFIAYTDNVDTINALSEFGLSNLLNVTVLYNDRIQPEVTLYSHDSKRILDSNSITILDCMYLIGFANSSNRSLDEVNGTVDLTVLLCPYKDHNEKTHIKAYLKSMNVTER